MSQGLIYFLLAVKDAYSHFYWPCLVVLALSLTLLFLQWLFSEDEFGSDENFFPLKQKDFYALLILLSASFFISPLLRLWQGGFF